MEPAHKKDVPKDPKPIRMKTQSFTFELLVYPKDEKREEKGKGMDRVQVDNQTDFPTNLYMQFKY